MKPIIDHSAFVGELNIPGTDKIAVQEYITQLVKEEQPEFLRELLGADTYWNLKTAVEASEQETDPVPLPLFYTELLNGKEIKEYIFEGVKKLFAHYIYVYYLTKTSTQTTTIGEVSTKKENSFNARPIYKQVDVWNSMLNKFYSLDAYMIANDQPAYKRSKHFFGKMNWLNI